MKTITLFCFLAAYSFLSLGDTLRPIYSDDVKQISFSLPEIACKKSISNTPSTAASYKPSVASSYESNDLNDFYIPNLKKFDIISGSMRPVIPIGSYILVDQCVDFKEINLGDIIVYKSKSFKQGTNYIVHRVVGKNNDTIIAKGDRNPRPDKELVHKNNFVGKVVHISSNLLSSYE